MALLSTAERQREVEVLLIRLLDGVRAATPRVLKSGDVSRAQMARIEKVLGSPGLVSNAIPQVSEEEWGRLLLAIARELGVIEIRDERMNLDIAAADGYFAMDEEARLIALREAWIASEFFNEFMHLTHLDVSQTRQNTRRSGGIDCVPGSQEIRRVRDAVLIRLDSLAEDKWLPLKTFLSEIEAEEPEVMLSGQSHPLAHTPDYIGIRRKGEKEDLPREGHWQNVEGELIREVLRVPLFLLGLVDYDESTKAPRIRTTTPSAWQGRVDPKPLMIQPNYDVMALVPEMLTPDIWRIARIASITSFAQATHFRLEEPWVIMAVNAGAAVKDLVEELNTASKTPVPQNVSFSIEEWGRRAERVTIWLDAVFVEAEGIEDIAERFADKGHEGFESVDERHVVFPFPSSSRFRDALPARAKELDYARTLPPVLLAKASGVVSLDHEGAHFRARQAVSRFADEIGLDRYQVSHASLARARETGLSADAVVKSFEELCSGDLPPLFEVKVRTWMSGQVVAKTAQPLLIHIDDARVAALLSEAPEVAEVFGTPVSLGDFAVSADSEGVVDKTLEELGFIREEGFGSDDRDQSSFALSFNAPAQSSSGFVADHFEIARARSISEGLRYAIRFAAPLMLRTNAGALKEATLVTPKTLWLDGKDGVVELDCRYLHRTELVKVSAIVSLEAAQ